MSTTHEPAPSTRPGNSTRTAIRKAGSSRASIQLYDVDRLWMAYLTCSIGFEPQRHGNVALGLQRRKPTSDRSRPRGRDQVQDEPRLPGPHCRGAWLQWTWRRPGRDTDMGVDGRMQCPSWPMVGWQVASIPVGQWGQTSDGHFGGWKGQIVMPGHGALLTTLGLASSRPSTTPAPDRRLPFLPGHLGSGPGRDRQRGPDPAAVSRRAGHRPEEQPAPALDPQGPSGPDRPGPGPHRRRSARREQPGHGRAGALLRRARLCDGLWPDRCRGRRGPGGGRSRAGRRFALHPRGRHRRPRPGRLRDVADQWGHRRAGRRSQVHPGLG